jgi:hypothetical protein
MEGKIEGRLLVTGRQRTRLKDVLTETGMYWEEEALH